MNDISSVPNTGMVAGAITNVEVYNLCADNATIGTSFESVNNTNADGLTPPILGEDVDVVSADAADASAGTGARTVKIWYLDASFNEGSETVTLNGTTPVEMTEQNITYILRSEIQTTGSGLASAGAITIAAVTGGEVFGVIDAGARDMGNCSYMVPAGHTGYVHGFWADVDAVAAGAGTAEIALQVAHAGFSGVVASETWRTIAKLTLVEGDNDIVAATGGNSNAKGYFQFPGGVPWKLPAKTMVRLAGKAGSTAVAATCGLNVVIQGSGSGTVETDN